MKKYERAVLNGSQIKQGEMNFKQKNVKRRNLNLREK